MFQHGEIYHHKSGLLEELSLKSLRKLRSEIDGARSDKEDLDWNEIIQKVPFLDCCLDVTMR